MTLYWYTMSDFFDKVTNIEWDNGKLLFLFLLLSLSWVSLLILPCRPASQVTVDNITDTDLLCSVLGVPKAAAVFIASNLVFVLILIGIGVSANYLFNTSKYQSLLKTDFSPTKPETGVRREGIPDNVKMFVWNRDGGRCVKCGGNLKLEYDHIIPLSLGGSNTVRNIQLLCENCNRSKGASLT